ncbi:hemagglutinin repeat-containing protein [Fusobacterium nucleatum]|uniref:hemagglutinin repeat-containing protein n=1 Tax=Fusobacterium nucleatum TaxID=851 RepID=UPI0021C40ED5|nr:hemagglutinin repeat-containing protein [Fusobacterium nucleatum]
MRNKFFKKFITVIFLLIYNIEIFAANLVVDPNSNYNTKLDESANGVPIVNISTPNKNGISINEFSEYNIDEKGQIINNADNIGRSHLAATTGKVNLKDGDFIGIDVEKGNIVIGPKGMDGTNANYVEIITKTLELRGNVVTNDLKVVTGSNSAVPNGDIAIDAKELGGMYANRIRIISTDKGAGVNSDAFIVSKNSKLEITADGKIKVNKIQGKGIDIKGKEYEQKDLAYSDEGISINADKIKLSGTGIQANKQINLNGTVENSATIYTKEGIKTKGLTNTGIVQAINKIEVEGNLTNNGEILTNKNLTAKDTISTKKLIAKDGISVGKLENSGVVVTEKNLNVNKNLINSGNVQAVGKISVVENTNNTGEILTNSSFTSKNTITTKKLIAKEGISVANLESSGIIATDKKLDIKGNLINSGEIQTLDNIIVKDNILNTGDILTNGTLTSKDVKNDKVISVSKDISIGKLENSGKVSTAKKLDINGNLTNLGNIQAVENISVTNNVLNKGTILTNGSFTSKDIKNEKELSANKDISVSKLENSGNVVSNSKININGVLTNTGELKALDSITVSGDTTNNGSILTNKNFVTFDLINNKKLIAKEKIDIKNLKNTGTIASGNKFTINGNFENTNNIETTKLDITGNKLTNSGSIKADNITTNVANITNDGKILSFNNISFSNAQNITNRNEITALKDIEANNTNLVNSGDIASNGKVLLNNSNITNAKKIASSTIEIKDNKKFDNTGEIKGNNVTLTTTNDIDLVGKLHGAQSLTISGKNITNNGETTGTGTTTITASNNFTNNKNLSAQTLTVTATGDVVNNKELNGGKVSITGNNIQNNDLIAAAGDLTLTATNKVDNKSGKTIFAGNKLTVTAKEIKNNKRAELLGSNIELTADKVRNEVGIIKAFNDITIKTDKFENIGEVENLGKYEKYYETWDGHELTEDEVNTKWKYELENHPSDKDTDYIREVQKEFLEKAINDTRNSPYKSLLFEKYEDVARSHLDHNDRRMMTSSAQYPEVVLKGKIRSKADTRYGKVLAGRNITIEGKNGGNSQEVLNKDAIISAGNTVKINANKIENSVSIGNQVQLKDGRERLDLDLHNHKNVTHTSNWFVRQIVDGDKAYTSGLPSVIEGKNVIINSSNIVKDGIKEANGEINEGNPKNKVIREEREVHTGVNKDIKKENIAPNQINVKDELKKYGNVGTDGAIYNGNSGINGQIVGSTKVIDKIIKSGTIDIDASLSSALFIKNISPNSKYIMETRLKYIDQKRFFGSDYFLSRVGYEDKWDRVKRLGDAYYENELIERSITEKLGTRFLNGKEISAKDLMDNAAEEAKKNGLTIGKALTKEQIAKLDKDIVWYEYQEVDGVQVLAPKVYLSQNTIKNLNTDSRSRITGIENTYVRTGNLENVGLIGGYGNTYVEAKEVNNRTLGNQLAEIRGNKTTIIAQNNINNIGAKISGNESLNLVAINGDIINKSTIKNVEYNFGELDRTRHSELVSVGQIVSNGNLNILGNNFTSTAALTKGDNVVLNVRENVNIGSLKLSGEEKFGSNSENYTSYAFEKNIGSDLEGKKLTISGNNLNIKGSSVIAENALINTKNVNIVSDVNYENRESSSKTKTGFLSSKSSEEKSHEETNSTANLNVKNKAIIKGDVNLVGSNLVLGNDSFVGGKVTTDSRELHSSYSYKESKKGFSGSIGSGGFSVGYGKSESKLKEKDLTNAKSNLVLGDGTTLNKGADITATNLIHGNISINNGDVKFGARKDVKDVETSSKSSGINLSLKIKSDALDRAKQGVDSFKQMKSGDILGGIASSTNTVTGIVSGLASNQGTKLPVSAAKADNTVGKDNLKAAQATNNFYANAGVNLGFNKSSSESKSHSESGVVTTIKGKNGNSSITYNDVKNIEYIGTQAQNTKFIYNNVENITKKAVELNNYSSSSSRSSGISAGVTIGYGDGIQTSVDAVKVSASKSKMNTNGTNFQNGRFVNVDEVHNNTKNMTLSGFNQEGGTVTGNIQNLTIESKQNTSTTTGSTKGGSLSIAPNGMPSGSANYSQTNGERKVVDSPTTFLIGDGSNLKVGKVENTAGAIGATGNGKLSIDEYVGHNLENVDKSKTVGGSVGISTSGINSIGINYNDRKQEGITKNTVIGNVEIGKSSGAEINKDLDSMTEITKDRKFETNINIESQTIKYALNPEAFKQDLKKAKNEIEDIGNVIENTVNPPGEDKRNFFKNLRAQRWDTSFYNVTGSRMEELSRQFKAGEIDEKQLKEAARDLIKGYGKDIGIDYEVVYLDEETMPKDAKGSTGSSYILDEKNRKVLIPIDVSKIGDINELFGTLTEEVSHGKDALEGRQDKKVAEDKSNNEKGLESLGRPANDYVKNKLGEDNNSKIKLSTDGINLTNANVGEKVGDYLPKHEIDAAGGVEKVLHFETSEEIAKIVGHKSNLEVLDNFLQGITNKNLWSGVYDFTPGVGDAKGFIEGLTGEDLITGEKISFFNRIIGGIPLIGRAADIFKTVNKPIKNGADFLVNLILDSSKGISKMDNINDTTKLVSVAEGVGDLGSDVTKVVVKEIKVADDSVDIAKTSKNVEKISDVSEDITKAVANEQTLEVIKTPLLKSNEVVLKDIKYETYYRSMNYNDYKKLIETGRLPSTKETFISPRQIYSEKYSGVLVEFKLEPGTTDKLAKIAVRDKSKKLIERYPNMSLVYNGWNYNNVYFKWEKKMQMNIGLGKGAGINLFNESIRSYEFKKIIK